MIFTHSAFNSLSDEIFKQRNTGEHFLLSLLAESSQFIRINGSKVRQIGTVDDIHFEITLIQEGASGDLRRATYALSLTGDPVIDRAKVQTTLALLRSEVIQLPPDPYAEIPRSGESSENSFRGELPEIHHASDQILASTHGLDLAGLYAGGSLIRAMANSSGQNHWFQTQTFSFDYSIYTAHQRATKGVYAGTHWNKDQFDKNLFSKRSQLEALQKPAMTIRKGEHRVYLEPAAVSNLISMFSWETLSESALQQGKSSLKRMRTEGRTFSPHFSLSEDFSDGQTPRFNSQGELSETRLSLIEKGALKNTLVSSRTAREYGATSNFAELSESQRAPSLTAGTLDGDQAAKLLDTGLYLSNLHYLNWSDQPQGRVTGMTRYACFWVENGKVIAPIENMRWDDSLFSIFGDSLLGLTQALTYEPLIVSYERRALGGMSVPGALLSKMNFTL